MKKIALLAFFSIYLFSCPIIIKNFTIILNKPQIDIKYPDRSKIRSIEEKYNIKIDIKKENFLTINFKLKKINKTKRFDFIKTELNLYSFFKNKDAIKSWDSWLNYLNKTKKSEDIELYKLISEKIINQLRDQFPNWTIKWEKPYLITFFTSYPDTKTYDIAKEEIEKMNIFLKKILYGAFIPLLSGKNVGFIEIVDEKDLKNGVKEVLEELSINKNDIKTILSLTKPGEIIFFIPKNCKLPLGIKKYGWQSVGNNVKIDFKNGCPKIYYLK